MIKIVNDWNWISKYVDKELENEELYDKVLAYMMKYNISLGRMKELYHDAVDYGMENGKYLSFSEWFQEFREGEKEREDYYYKNEREARINDFI